MWSAKRKGFLSRRTTSERWALPCPGCPQTRNYDGGWAWPPARSMSNSSQREPSTRGVVPPLVADLTRGRTISMRIQLLLDNSSCKSTQLELSKSSASEFQGTQSFHPVV